MMDWTDRHCRYFMRLLSRHTRLYTEMVTTGALIHGDTGRFLRFDPDEHPLALQLGGSNAQELAQCTALAFQRGFDEVNLNAGCPSDRVQNNKIGACLMAEPVLVRDCLAAMRDAADIRVTLKTRIGIDDMDSDQALVDFIGTVIESGIDTVILHARIAILAGLSPKQNREVPPLNYARPALVKNTFPDLKIVINGGITSLEQSSQLLQTFDGVMMGREAYQHPWILSQIDSLLFGDKTPCKLREEALQAFYPYVEKELASGTSLHHMTRHILGLFQGQPGAKKFRRLLSENAWKQDADLATLRSAVNLTQTQDIAC
jgi:tRNA-dihydrouridine synthase A